MEHFVPSLSAAQPRRFARFISAALAAAVPLCLLAASTLEASATSDRAVDVESAVLSVDADHVSLDAMRDDVAYHWVVEAVSNHNAVSLGDEVDLEALVMDLEATFVSVELVRGAPKYRYVEVDGEIFLLCYVEDTIVVVDDLLASPVVVRQIMRSVF